MATMPLVSCPRTLWDDDLGSAFLGLRRALQMTQNLLDLAEAEPSSEVDEGLAKLGESLSTSLKSLCDPVRAVLADLCCARQRIASPPPTIPEIEGECAATLAVELARSVVGMFLLPIRWQRDFNVPPEYWPVDQPVDNDAPVRENCSLPSSGQHVEAVAESRRRLRVHRGRHPFDYNELIAAVENEMGIAQSLRSPLRPSSVSQHAANPEQTRQPQDDGCDWVDGPWKPSPVLRGWEEILAAINQKFERPMVERIATYNEMTAGPITNPVGGGKVLVEQARLLNWWAWVMGRLNEIDQRRVDREAAASQPTHSYGQTGEVAPEVEGTVRRTRRRKKPEANET